MQTITQTQMQTFDHCRRSYFLRYLRKLVWPGENPHSREAARGDDFHLLVRQMILGLPRESLIFPVDDDGTLTRWVDLFCGKQPLGKFDRVFAERDVSALYSGVLWLGKFDALTVHDGKLTVFDWKTGAKKPDPAKYRKSPQTRLYLMLARSCAKRLFPSAGDDYPAEQIEMIYWFPEHPASPIRFPYSETEWQKDLTWLRMRAVEMCRTDEAAYPMTDNRSRCQYCTYFSCCFPKDAVLSSAPLPEEDPDNFPAEIYQESLFSPPLPEDAVSF